jgi:hypothetical protein
MELSVALRAAGISIAFATVSLVSDAAWADETPAPPAPAKPQQQAAATPAPPAEAPPAAEAPQKDGGNHPAPNSIYLEGLGAGLAYSLNYERMVVDDVGVRVGFSYLSFGSSATTPSGTTSASASFLSIPITASYIGIRGRKSSLELGGGMSLNYASGSGSSLGASASGSGMIPYGVAMVGYRLHPVDGAGFMFRVGLMALAGNGLALSAADPTKFGVLPWGYISFGASF